MCSIDTAASGSATGATVERKEEVNPAGTKRRKMADLRTFVETKLLSRSEKTLEKPLEKPVEKPPPEKIQQPPATPQRPPLLTAPDHQVRHRFSIVNLVTLK